MNSWTIALITFCCVAGGALAGMGLRGLLPEHHLSEPSKDTIKLVAGLLATLSALVLGLLIASAKNSFDAIGEEFKQAAVRVILLDRTLAQYGPEAQHVREALRDAYVARIRQLFPEGGGHGTAEETLRGPSSAEQIPLKIQSLSPVNDLQRSLKARALELSYEIRQARWNAVEQAGSGTPPVFLAVLVFWLAGMFASFGLFAPRNATATTALALGALAVATAIFLIEEMNDPLGGIIRISSVPMRSALAVLGK
jgi:hypothetical protein